MLKNEIQDYLNKNFPELKFIVHQDSVEPRGYLVGFRTDIKIKFYLMPQFDKVEKIDLLYHIEEMLYQKLGLLNKAVDDIRKLRREII